MLRRVFPGNPLHWYWRPKKRKRRKYNIPIYNKHKQNLTRTKLT